jgi:hypothetical protein
VFQRPRAPLVTYLPVLLIALAISGWAWWLLPRLLSSHSTNGGLRLLPVAQPRARARTLVVYVFGGSDPEYGDNLSFFINEAVKVRPPCAAAPAHSPPVQSTHPTPWRYLLQEGDGCDYIIVLQQGKELPVPDPLPALPSNARYLQHANECFDIGTVGWVLENHVPRRSVYSYFIWLNSSVRGPFLPSYLSGVLHWTEPLLSKLNDRVKLVGPTINCGRAYDLPPTVHVQSYVSATDAAGLEVLLNTGTVFKCWGHIHDTIISSEIGASTAIMAAGYSIDSLMLRYKVRYCSLRYCKLCCLLCCMRLLGGKDCWCAAVQIARFGSVVWVLCCVLDAATTACGCQAGRPAIQFPGCPELSCPALHLRWMGAGRQLAGPSVSR